MKTASRNRVKKRPQPLYGLEFGLYLAIPSLRYYVQAKLRDRNVVYVKIKKNHLWSLYFGKLLPNFFRSVAKRPFFDRKYKILVFFAISKAKELSQ